MTQFFNWDPCKKIVVLENYQEALIFSVKRFIEKAKQAVSDHGNFFVALSGGSTPKAIFQLLTSSPYQEQVDWKKVVLFWGDERSVPPQDKDSNYHMAMTSGLEKMGIPKEQIYRMHAEENIEENAATYEKTIRRVLNNRPFDWIMLGMGDDGHTASLFPHTKALYEKEKLAVANYVPQKETFRMTLTFSCINQAQEAAFFIFGEGKATTVHEVLTEPRQFELFPSQNIGTPERPSLWILDQAAASLIKKDL